MNISLNKHAQTEVQVGTCQLCLMCSARIPCSMLCTLCLWSHALSEMLCLYQALAVRLHSLQSWTINLHSQTNCIRCQSWYPANRQSWCPGTADLEQSEGGLAQVGALRSHLHVFVCPASTQRQASPMAQTELDDSWLAGEM